MSGALLRIEHLKKEYPGVTPLKDVNLTVNESEIIAIIGSSGSGKTLITCGLLEALKRRGTDVRAYKCGPDYIDPMFHRSVLGIPGGNLDTFFSADDEIRQTIAECGSEAAVIEGVMGIFDGVTGMQRFPAMPLRTHDAAEESFPQAVGNNYSVLLPYAGVPCRGKNHE